MKILCYVNHFFGKNPHFLGKSSPAIGTDLEEFKKKADCRKKYVSETIAQLRKLGTIDIKICGINGFSLLPLDISFDSVKDKPLWLIYESLNHMAQFADDYDYFINLEDDIYLPEETFMNVLEFDKTSLINEVFLPNRLEKTIEGKPYCVDLMAIPGWTQQRKRFQGKQLRVALNAHSAILILSREKFRYTLKSVDKMFRQSILHNELDSAFAYFHSSFALFRSEDIGFHFVDHLDKWYYSPGELMHTRTRTSWLNGITGADFIPPIFVKIFSFLNKLQRKKV